MSNRIRGGKGDKTNPQDVCPKELRVGIAVEYEHTDDRETATEIALDHLAENPTYYSELVKKGIVDEPEAMKLAKEFWGIVKEDILDRMPTGAGYYHQYTPLAASNKIIQDTPEGLRHPVDPKKAITDINDLFEIIIGRYE